MISSSSSHIPNSSYKMRFRVQGLGQNTAMRAISLHNLGVGLRTAPVPCYLQGPPPFPVKVVMCPFPWACSGSSVPGIYTVAEAHNYQPRKLLQTFYALEPRNPKRINPNPQILSPKTLCPGTSGIPIRSISGWLEMAVSTFGIRLLWLAQRGFFGV